MEKKNNKISNGVNKQNKKLTKEQITELLKSHGQKLGFLIAGSTLPEKAAR